MENGEWRKSESTQTFSILNSAFFIILLLAAFALRVCQLGAQSLWFDEGWSWHLATMPLDQMALTTAGDRSPFAYYALLHFWVQIAGASEFGMRYISVIVDVITTVLVMALAHALTRSRASSLLAGLIYALCPLVVWYAQETRMYALVATLCTASSYWLWRWLHSRRPTMEDRRLTTVVHRPSSIVYLIASAALLELAIYCHYYAIFLLPAQFVAVLLRSFGARRSPIANCQSLIVRRPIVQWLIAAAIVVVGLIPWLLIASTGFAYDDGFIFPLNTIAGRSMEWFRAFASGGMAILLPEWWPWALGLASISGVVGFASLATKDRWHALGFVIVLIIMPLLAATIAVRIVYPYRSVFHPRYLIYIAPAACVLFGATSNLKYLKPASRAINVVLRLSSIIALMALWLPTLIGYFTQPALARDDTRDAVKHVVEALEPGDVVMMSRDNFAVRYYWPKATTDVAPTLLAAPDGLHGVLSSDESVIDKLIRTEPKRVRLMLWQDNVVDPQKFVESTLWANGFQLGEYNFGQMRLPLYQIERAPITRVPLKSMGVLFGDPNHPNGGDQLELKRYWQSKQGFAGDWFYLVLEWEPRAPLSKDYKVFVHVLDQNGKLVFQQDKLALSELLPMSRWQPGRMMRDAYAMVIPTALPAGNYRVEVGVYDPQSGQRLPARSRQGDPGTPVPLGEVQVMRR